jgi:hypothetical protein
MRFPSECKMPDLSNLEPLWNRLLTLLLIGAPGLNKKTTLYLREYIRLVEKALKEYGEARNVILEVIEEINYKGKTPKQNARLAYAFTFPNHMETCIDAIRRIYRLIDGISGIKEDAALVPRELRKLVSTRSKSIISMRNTVQHLDRDIGKGIPSGKPIMLAVNDNADGILISSHEMKFDQIAIVLKRMHEIALHIMVAGKTTRNGSLQKTIPET